MKHKLFLVLLILVLFFSLANDLFCASEKYKSQLQMVSARLASLGGTVPTILGDINGSFINPATMGDIESTNFAYSYQNIMGSFVYTQVNSCFQYNDITWGVSYGGDMLFSIPETSYENSRIRAIDTYAAGFSLLKGTMAKTFYDIWGINTLSVGANAKLYKQEIKTEYRYGYGLDVGGIFSFNLEDSVLEKMHLGVSLVDIYAKMNDWNGISTNDKLSGYGLWGVKFDFFEETLSLFLQRAIDGYYVPFFSRYLGDVSLGVEYISPADLYLRAAADSERISVGTGLRFANIIGFNLQEYSLQIDYGLTFPQTSVSLPTHMITFSLLGEDRALRPKILYPLKSFLTKDRAIRLSGIAAKSTKVSLYNNDKLYKIIWSDKFGYWSVDEFPLKDGENRIYLHSEGLEQDVSLKSNAIIVYSDNTAPKINSEVIPDVDKLKIKIKSSEPLELAEVDFDHQLITFKEEATQEWVATLPLPKKLANNAWVRDKMSEANITVRDKAGNETLVKVPFFLSVENPLDKAVVYKSYITVLGHISEMIKELSIKGRKVASDKNNAFSYPYTLEYGKNIINFKVLTFNNTTLNYKARVLRLKTFKDLKEGMAGKREVEALATLGVLEGDGFGAFFPEQLVLQADLAKIAGVELTEEQDPKKAVTVGQVKEILGTTGLFYKDEEQVTKLKLAVLLAHASQYRDEVKNLLDMR
jgi:hypothetical protein